jgi:hypothetical protein
MIGPFQVFHLCHHHHHHSLLLFPCSAKDVN